LELKFVDARDQLEKVKAEKIELLEKAGLNYREMPAGLDDLPISAEDWGPRLHGIREARRSELTTALESAGLLAPRPQPEARRASGSRGERRALGM
jgi:hypothetical protein